MSHLRPQRFGGEPTPGGFVAKGGIKQGATWAEGMEQPGGGRKRDMTGDCRLDGQYGAEVVDALDARDADGIIRKGLLGCHSDKDIFRTRFTVRGHINHAAERGQLGEVFACIRGGVDQRDVRIAEQGDGVAIDFDDFNHPAAGRNRGQRVAFPAIGKR